MTAPLPAVIPLNRQQVAAAAPAGLKAPAADRPYFLGPRVYMKVAKTDYGPRFGKHNHDPALAVCDNGDLLAIWYTCVNEPGTELGILASRLRAGASERDEPSTFWDTPDRNDHAPALWNDGHGQLYHFNGNYGLPGSVVRTSTDNGVTWTAARRHSSYAQPGQPIFRTADGVIVTVCDGGAQSSEVIISRDRGETWISPAEPHSGQTDFKPGGQGPNIAGIHAGVAELRDGRWLALGRFDKAVFQNAFGDRLPLSLSADQGRTWTYEASPFPTISSCQRPTLLRLREGPLLFFSFTAPIVRHEDPDKKPGGYIPPEKRPGLTVRDGQGKEFTGYGLYAALSFDEGKTWPQLRLVSDAREPRQEAQTDGDPFTYGPTTAEWIGYLAAVQAPDGMIHLISSKNHYAMNYSWLTEGAANPGGSK